MVVHLHRISRAHFALAVLSVPTSFREFRRQKALSHRSNQPPSRTAEGEATLGDEGHTSPENPSTIRWRIVCTAKPPVRAGGLQSASADLDCRSLIDDSLSERFTRDTSTVRQRFPLILT